MSVKSGKHKDDNHQEKTFRLSPVTKLVKAAVIASVASSVALTATAQEAETETNAEDNVEVIDYKSPAT